MADYRPARLRHVSKTCIRCGSSRRELPRRALTSFVRANALQTNASPRSTTRCHSMALSPEISRSRTLSVTHADTYWQNGRRLCTAEVSGSNPLRSTSPFTPVCRDFAIARHSRKRPGTRLCKPFANERVGSKRHATGLDGTQRQSTQLQRQGETVLGGSCLNRSIPCALWERRSLCDKCRRVASSTLVQRWPRACGLQLGRRLQTLQTQRGRVELVSPTKAVARPGLPGDPDCLRPPGAEVSSQARPSTPFPRSPAVHLVI
jgi:hypothetical protein